MVSRSRSQESDVLRSGVVVGERFRLVRELGRGGMGAVWLARHEALQVPCAVKFILEHRADDEESRARFRYEARAAAQVRSPNVVQILDYGVWEDIPYIAMEALEGETLTDLLEREGRLTLDETCEVVTGVSHALARAAARGIVHRDLKPDNIFIVRDGDTIVPKVLDFGVAKSIFGSDGLRVETVTGAILGTPYYLSPEQAHGSKAVDHRSDLWSLAVISYECVTGQLPFDREGLGDLISAIMHGPIPMPTDELAFLPAELDVWWRRAAARDPEARFQSAMAMADSLAAVCADDRSMGATIGSQPSPTVLRAPHPLHETLQGQEVTEPRRGRGRRGLLVGAAAALLGVVIGVAATTASEPPARQAPALRQAKVAVARPMPEPESEPEPEPPAPSVDPLATRPEKLPGPQPLSVARPIQRPPAVDPAAAPTLEPGY